METATTETTESTGVDRRGAESYVEWLDRRTPEEWRLNNNEFLRPVLQRGDQRVMVDLSKNSARWEKRVGEPLEPAVKRINGDTIGGEGGPVGSRLTKAGSEKWVFQDFDKYERICPLVVGRILRLEDSRVRIEE